jgi:hypothetical protein
VGDRYGVLKIKISNLKKDDISNLKSTVEEILSSVWVNKTKTAPFITVYRMGSNKVVHK